jgi:hypothetical protein
MSGIARSLREDFYQETFHLSRVYSILRLLFLSNHPLLSCPLLEQKVWRQYVVVLGLGLLRAQEALGVWPERQSPTPESSPRYDRKMPYHDIHLTKTPSGSTIPITDDADCRRRVPNNGALSSRGGLGNGIEGLPGGGRKTIAER